MKNLLLILVVGVAVGYVGLQAVGCSGSKIRHVDVRAGEYYSEDEYDLLPTGKQQDYCQQLESEMMASQREFEEKQTEIQETKDLIQSIRRQIVPIEQEVLRLESDIRSLKDQIAEVKALPKKWKVRPGDTLTIIAMEKRIYNDIEKWWKIFEANRDKIDDPYYIFPDTTLVIPRDWPVD